MRVSFVIVSSNWKRLGPCWAALEGQTGSAFQVVLVDYGRSQELSAHVTASRLGQERRVIVLDGRHTNINVARNRALELIAHFPKESRPEFIASLDDDARPEPDWLENMVAAADGAEAQVGMFASTVLAMCRHRIRSAGHTLVPWGRPDRGFRQDMTRPLPSGKPLCPCHVAALLRWSLVDDICSHEPFLDEDIEHYWTCFDAGIKAHLLGWRCDHVGSAVVTDAGFDADHPHGVNESVEQKRLKQQSRLALSLKYIPDEYLPAALIAQLSTSTSRLLREPQGGAIVAAAFEALGQTSDRLLAKRQRWATIGKERGTSASMLSPDGLGENQTIVEGHVRGGAD